MQKLIERMSDETGSAVIDRLVFALGILSLTIAIGATLISGTAVAETQAVVETNYL